MGLIREVQEVSKQLSKTEQARLERENFKQLQEEYKKDCYKYLYKYIFNKLYDNNINSNYDYDFNLKLIYDTKNDIILEVAKIIKNIKILKDKDKDRIKWGEVNEKDLKEYQKKYKIDIFTIVDDLELIFDKVLKDIETKYKKEKKINQDCQIELIYNRILKELQIEINSKKWTKKELQSILKNNEYQNNILEEINENLEKLKIERIERNEIVMNEVLKKLNIVIKNSNLKEKEEKTRVQIPTIWKVALGLKAYNKAHNIFKNKRYR